MLLPHEIPLDERYITETSTTSESERVQTTKQAKEGAEEAEEKYTSGKPRRIIIRAKITHDQGES